MSSYEKKGLAYCETHYNQVALLYHILYSVMFFIHVMFATLCVYFVYDFYTNNDNISVHIP